MFNRDPYVFANHQSIPEPIRRVVIGVFQSWDRPVTDYKYVQHFKPDGVLHLGPDPTEGRGALHELHAKVINPDQGPTVDSQHYVDRLFMLSGMESDKIEVVVTGLHEITMADGARVMMDFASWVIMSKGVDEGFELQAERWRVFQDQAKLKEALTKLEECETGGSGTSGHE